MRVIIFLITGVIIGLAIGVPVDVTPKKESVLSVQEKQERYWFLLHRKSNIEYLYRGVSGSVADSKLIKKFQVKTGAPGSRPTPLPQLLGREYWIVINKYDTKETPETAPYFIGLDVPASDVAPFGPVPYLECDGQCNWEIPGPFGLHGINADPTRIAADNLGSSGCVRHNDEDIIFLYHLLDPEAEEIRYYIEDI